MKSRVLVPLLTLISKNFLASQISINTEPFQRTDISTQPLGPTILEVINESQKNGRVKEEEALENGTFIFNSKNKSEGKAEECANSSQ